MENFTLTIRLEDLEVYAVKYEGDSWEVKLKDIYSKDSDTLVMTGEELGASIALAIPHAGQFENMALTTLLYEIAEKVRSKNLNLSLIP